MRSFLFSAIFSLIANEYSIWISELLLVGVALQAACYSVWLKRLTALVMSSSVFNGMELSSVVSLKIGPISFYITESARFVFSHYFMSLLLFIIKITGK